MSRVTNSDDRLDYSIDEPERMEEETREPTHAYFHPPHSPHVPHSPQAPHALQSSPCPQVTEFHHPPLEQERDDHGNDTDAEGEHEELPITLNRSIVEDIIDHMQQDNEPYTDNRKQHIKTAFQKIYDSNGIFDIEHALQKTILAYIVKFNAKTYISFMQTFKQLLKDACHEKILPFDFAKSRINKIISLACNAHQLPPIKNVDTYRASAKSYPIWRELEHKVLSYVKPILAHIHEKDYHLVDIEDLKTALRTMLYVREHPPRRDEYRLLVERRLSDTGRFNLFIAKNAKIHLEDYATFPMYGVFEFKLSDDTADLFDELCRRQEDAQVLYIFGCSSDPDHPPTEIDWEEAVIKDFVKIANRELDTLALRTIYLAHVKALIKNDPIKRIETVVDMGHCLQEHFVLSRFNVNLPEKRKTDSNDPLNKSRQRIE